VRSVAFSPDGKRLASGAGSWTRGKPGEVKVWEAQTGKEVLTLQGHTGEVYSVAFSPNGKRIASGSWDQTVKVWEAQSGQLLHDLQGHTADVKSVAFSPDGRRLASGGAYKDGDTWKGEVKVWDAQTGHEVLALKGHTSFVYSVAFSADGQRLASASGWPENQVKVWDAQTGQQVLPLRGQTSLVTGVAFSANGQRVIAVSDKGVVRAWDAQSGQPILPCTDPPPPVQPQALSPDAQRLVRIVNGQPVVQPRFLHADDWFNRRLHDQARMHFWHLRMAQEARRDNDAFALHFHLRPLLLTAITRWRGRPHDSFPYWAWRPPLTRSQIAAPTPEAIAVTEAELRRLLAELDRQVQAEPKAWEAWAARGWCRHLLGNPDDTLANLKQASELRPDEPGLWALRGTVCAKHQRLDQAEAIHKRLTAWQGIDVQVWHACEDRACQAEGARQESAWHRQHLRDKQGN
jgi:hypothetical protein